MPSHTVSLAWFECMSGLKAYALVEVPQRFLWNVTKNIQTSLPTLHHGFGCFQNIFSLFSFFCFSWSCNSFSDWLSVTVVTKHLFSECLALFKESSLAWTKSWVYYTFVSCTLLTQTHCSKKKVLRNISAERKHAVNFTKNTVMNFKAYAFSNCIMY